jgi:hypothetical protein
MYENFSGKSLEMWWHDYSNKAYVNVLICVDSAGSI